MPENGLGNSRIDFRHRAPCRENYSSRAICADEAEGKTLESLIVCRTQTFATSLSIMGLSLIKHSKKVAGCGCIRFCSPFREFRHVYCLTSFTPLQCSLPLPCGSVSHLYSLHLYRSRRVSLLQVRVRFSVKTTTRRPAN